MSDLILIYAQKTQLGTLSSNNELTAESFLSFYFSVLCENCVQIEKQQKKIFCRSI